MNEPFISRETAIGAAVLVWCLNYLAAKLLGYPFLYCWLYAPAAWLYMAWGHAVLFCVALMVVYYGFTAPALKALGWAIIGVLVIELPNATDYVFRLGASCDG